MVEMPDMLALVVHDPGFLHALGSYALSAALGALIGLERQWSGQKSGRDEEQAGVRTFVLWAVLGAVSAQIGTFHAPGTFPVVFALMILGTLGAAWLRRESSEVPGLTSLAALALTFLLGGLAFWGERRLALVLAGCAFLLLAKKEGVHAFSRHFNEQDKRSLLKFLLISAVILPVVPNADFGPHDGFNPFKTWLMVVLVTGLGLASYAGMRVLGSKAGLGLTGLLGGLVSSTAATLALSRQNREFPGAGASLAWATIIACTFLHFRIAILLGAVSPSLLGVVWPALLALAAPGVLFAAWRFLLAKPEEPPKSIEIHNPANLRVALVFASLYALITLLVKAANAHLGPEGIQLASFVSGLTDMDAIALSLGVMVADQSVSGETARAGIVLAAVANTLFKGGIALSLGKTSSFRLPILLVFGATILIGIVLLTRA